MSPVVIPFAYRLSTASLKPASRRVCLGTTVGVKVPARSRGTLMRTSPTSVRVVFGLDPLRTLPDPDRQPSQHGCPGFGAGPNLVRKPRPPTPAHPQNPGPRYPNPAILS